MSIKNVEYPEPVPLRVDNESSDYVRIKYQYIPPYVQGQNTVTRFLERYQDEPEKGYIYHDLKSGETAKFEGRWSEEDDASKTVQECALIFAENEVVCIPIKASLLHLHKVENSSSSDSD